MALLSGIEAKTTPAPVIITRGPHRLALGLRRRLETWTRKCCCASPCDRDHTCEKSWRVGHGAPAFVASTRSSSTSMGHA